MPKNSLADREPWWTAEEAIRISDIPRVVPPRPDGRKVSVDAAFRWSLVGLRGIRLRRFKLGGAWHTTREELVRWSSSLTSAAEAKGG